MSDQTHDCFACSAQGLMPLDEALADLSRRLQPVTGFESVPLASISGRILAEDLIAPLDQPPHDNSAVDGYAVSFADLIPGQSVRLPIGGRIAAGHPLAEAPKPGHAYRIFTGAPCPAGLDTIAMQEDCREEDGFVLLPAKLSRDANRRLRGEDMHAGNVVLAAGRRLWPFEAGIAAACGKAELKVRTRLRVALFSTGDELRSPGQPLDAGCIYDSNRFTLMALLTQAGCQITDLGTLPDRFETIRDALADAAKNHDLIVTSGGVSVGEEDHVKAAVEANGALNFWRLAIKPGKPVALGQVGGTPFLGLPGNPVAVVLTMSLIGATVIAALSGANPPRWRRFQVPAAETIRKKAGRREFPRAHLVETPFGLAAQRFRSDSSGVLTSLSESEGFLDLPEGEVACELGDPVFFLPFSEVFR